MFNNNLKTIKITHKTDPHLILIFKYICNINYIFYKY